MSTLAKEAAQASSIERPHTVIVGGSLAGLFSALPLLHAGHRVTILERATTYSSASTQASGISMGPYVQQYLKRFDRFVNEPLALLSNGVNFLNPDGSIKRTVPHKGWNVSWGGIWARMRRNFEAANEEEGSPSSVKRAEYKASVTVIDIKCENGGYTVSYTDASSLKNEVVDEIVNVPDETTKSSTQPSQTLKADFLIAADGASSTTKRLLTPPSFFSSSPNSTSYSGYVAWRGTVLESLVSETTSSLFQGRLCSTEIPGGYILVYHVPGPDAEHALEPGHRVLNFVWYSFQTPSALKEILTDRSGRLHRRSMAAGSLRDEIWARQRAEAEKSMPKEFLELIRSVERPFVQVIEDSMAGNPLLWPTASGGSQAPPPVLLTGEALATIRPNTGQGVNMIARGALYLADVADGKLGLEEAANAFHCELVDTRYQAIAFGDYLIHGTLAWLWGKTGWLGWWVGSRARVLLGGGKGVKGLGIEKVRS